MWCRGRWSSKEPFSTCMIMSGSAIKQSIFGRNQRQFSCKCGQFERNFAKSWDELLANSGVGAKNSHTFAELGLSMVFFLPTSASMAREVVKNWSKRPAAAVTLWQALPLAHHHFCFLADLTCVGARKWTTQQSWTLFEAHSDAGDKVWMVSHGA